MMREPLDPNSLSPNQPPAHTLMPPEPSPAHDPHRRGLMILGAHDVARQLQGRERALMEVAAKAYVTHARGESCLPQSEYLRFPGKERERIIPKAGYLGGSQPVAGIKWISSFPDNTRAGMPRASAVIVLNDVNTGRPTTVMEGSLISCQRTAAGAALAARHLHQQPSIGTLGLFGCGLIGQEILRFILADTRPVDSVLLYDVNRAYSRALAEALRAKGFRGEVAVSRSRKEMVARSDVLVFATSAVKPSLDSIEHAPAHATLLHVSLRDFTVNAVLQADNLADDIEHVLQAQTSAHRTAQLTGRRDFVRATLADVMEGRAAPRIGDRPVMFHPFGLAALDLAFAQDVALRCADAGQGQFVAEFLL
ncbi:MAG: 2,3-diaminopropionate biosynthesis protein SbnB [Rubrivivax sp.]|jgi:2,3-diaminopropionate biosynthesis protein SbnB|nr:2,3-diaminopropionate biosynthesis protein SbnB [Rubrivivax sp.]